MGAALPLFAIVAMLALTAGDGPEPGAFTGGGGGAGAAAACPVVAAGFAEPSPAGVAAASGFASPFCNITAPAAASPMSSNSTTAIKPHRVCGSAGIDIDGSRDAYALFVGGMLPGARYVPGGMLAGPCEYAFCGGMLAGLFVGGMLAGPLVGGMLAGRLGGGMLAGP